MRNLFEELKRRSVIKVGAAYIVTTWLILQVTSIVVPALLLPGWTMSLITLLLIIGFFPAVIFAWAFELTPDGIKIDGVPKRKSSRIQFKGRQLDLVIIGVLVVAVLTLLAERTVFRSAPDQDTVAATTQVAEVKNPGQTGPMIEQRPRTSLAVLPFSNFGTSDQECFSDGVSEELLNLLAQTKGLRVVARTSSFVYKHNAPDIRIISKALKVETILEGSVRWAGTKLRITAQLIDVETGYHLWSKTYDRELTDVFAVQDEISATIVSSLQIHLAGEPLVATPTDLGAYKLYLQGRHVMKERTYADLTRAAEFFDQVLAIDENYVPALTGKSDVIMLLSRGSYGDTPVAVTRLEAQSLIDRALTIDPGSAEALTSQGFVHALAGEDEAALHFFDLAIARNPNLANAYQWRGNALANFGRPRRRHLKSCARSPHFFQSGDRKLGRDLDRGKARTRRARALSGLRLCHRDLGLAPRQV